MLINSYFSSSVCFPKVSSSLYCVGGQDGVQVWTDQAANILSIPSPVTGVAATMVRLSQDGRHVISGWSDNCVRLHTPETGKLVEEIRNCVTGGEGVTALSVGRDVMVIGGADGSTRLWSLPRYSNSKLVKTVG